eukprot:4339067-Alexandrium_andersonii.AAC.1
MQSSGLLRGGGRAEMVHGSLPLPRATTWTSRQPALPRAASTSASVQAEEMGPRTDQRGAGPISSARALSA